MMSLTKRLMMILPILLGARATLAMETVYDNGPSDTASGVGFGTFIVADDFVLSCPASVSSVVFHGGHSIGLGLGSTIEWTVHVDAGGDPGTALASGTGQNLVVTPVGTAGGSSVIYLVEFDLDQPVALDAGVGYWLALQAPNAPAPARASWRTTSQQTGQVCHRRSPGSETWITVNTDLTFSLLGSGIAEGDVYDNGAFNGSSGGGFGNSITADDFQLSCGATLTSASLDAFHTLGLGLGSSIDWYIYDDAQGSPGALLMNGASQNLNVTETGPGGGSTIFYHATFDFGMSIPLDGGVTYWLGLQASAAPAGAGAAWGVSVESSGAPRHRFLGGAWTPATTDVSFVLTAAAPCPADTNEDGVVNAVDLVNVILAWGTADSSADVNGDGNVNALDLVDVVLGWGACA